MAKNIKAWNNAHQINEGSKGFKNKIINGDFSVNQRENPLIVNETDYPIDRVMVEATNSSIFCTTEDTYSNNEGSLVDSKDPLEDGSLISFYQFDNDLNNLGSSNNSLTDVDGGLTYDSGKYNNCVVKNGNRLHWDDDVGTIMDNGTAFSLSMFVYFDSNDAPPTAYRIVDFYSKVYAYAQIHIQDLETLRIDGAVLPIGKIGFNKFNHFVLSYSDIPTNDHTVTVYINGRRIGAVECSGRDAKSDHSGLCSYYKDASDYYSNKIDEFRIFNKALTEDEVKKLYVEDSNYIQKKHYKCEVLTKDTDPIINPYVYNFEGQDIVNIINKDLALSFDFMSNKTGTYNVSLVTQCLDGTTEEYATTFDYNKDDFERINIVIPANTFTKRIIDNHNLGASVYIAKESNDNLDPGDTIRLANVQLEEGSTATDFELVPKDTQLQRCMRYFEKGAFWFGNDGADKGNKFVWSYFFKTIKRAYPSIKVDNYDSYQTDTALGINDIFALNFSSPASERELAKKQCLLSTSPKDDGYYVAITGEIKIDAEL